VFRNGQQIIVTVGNFTDTDAHPEAPNIKMRP
jgi:hypothetical protein